MSTSRSVEQQVNEAVVPAERIYAGYLALQAFMGIALWVVFGTAPYVRRWFELMPERHQVMDAFLVADVVVVVVGSGVSAWALWTDRTWSVPVVAFTAGAILYPTLYLIDWVALTGTGTLCLAIMVPTSTLTCWVSYQTWRSFRSAARTPGRAGS